MKKIMTQTRSYNETWGRMARTSKFIALLVAGLSFATGRAAEQTADWPGSLPDIGDGRFGQAGPLKRNVARSIIDDALQIEPVPADADFKTARLENTRGVELASLYHKAAPGVVLILAGRGFGSGFVINKDGWLLTNHHVARGGSLQDDLMREVMVMFGHFNEQGAMEPLPERYPAEVYKWDRVRDLALLKLKSIPAWAGQSGLPVISVSDKGIDAGDDVAAIGNAGVTLLWSLKPGVVQGVGRRLADQAGDFAFHELRAEQAANLLAAPETSEMQREVEKELEPMRNVMVVQATCPILHGDSGGPLLDLAEGRAVGITSYGNNADAAGDPALAAHFFIHANEIREFLKEVPGAPMQTPPSFWDTPTLRCDIFDLDADGQPDIVRLSQTVSAPNGVKTNLIVGYGWDFAESSDLKAFQQQTTNGMGWNGGAVYVAKAMRLQMYLALDNARWVCAYDLENDGHFGLVRLGLNQSAFCDSELYSEGPGKPYQLRRLPGREPVLLRSERMPEAWRTRYQKVVLEALKAGKKN
jgi:S1-C subfamily serine protease